MAVTLGQLINGVGYLQIEISAIRAFTEIVADPNTTAGEKSNAKTEIVQRLKGIYKLLNTVAQKEGFTPNTDAYTDQELIDRKIV